MKVLIDLFQKVAGLGAAPHKMRFLLIAFLLRLPCQKKSGCKGLQNIVATRNNCSFHSHFFFDKPQRKSLQKETAYAGLRAPRPRHLLKKVDENFCTALAVKLLFFILPHYVPVRTPFFKKT